MHSTVIIAPASGWPVAAGRTRDGLHTGPVETPVEPETSFAGARIQRGQLGHAQHTECQPGEAPIRCDRNVHLLGLDLNSDECGPLARSGQ